MQTHKNNFLLCLLPSTMLTAVVSNFIKQVVKYRQRAVPPQKKFRPRENQKASPQIMHTYYRYEPLLFVWGILLLTLEDSNGTLEIGHWQ